MVNQLDFSLPTTDSLPVLDDTQPSQAMQMSSLNRLTMMAQLQRSQSSLSAKAQTQQPSPTLHAPTPALELYNDVQQLTGEQQHFSTTLQCRRFPGLFNAEERHMSQL
ncbi:hypothetical protein BCR37DRAFT_248350 [Protomyces lactucae-debilis]|uniref:Uncharacterized protein n=1 Tax=Protomyces lactucae-debilis TaxID=2754530 RepID=A0A1Y2FP07_PROLT|nr:uncharacterized protein BCR37DRAFT_248350 [Protomyces lactucae-debilis]ORY85708.1 hypothetical protein BCR37DRAFT_248350 [Protomyces lactucae-debilis]